MDFKKIELHPRTETISNTKTTPFMNNKKISTGKDEQYDNLTPSEQRMYDLGVADGLATCAHIGDETKLIDALKEEIEDYKEVLNKVAYGDHERTKSAIAQRVLGKYREKSKEAEYNSPPKNPPYITIDELRELEEINNSQPAPNQPSEDKLIEWTKEIELCLPQIKNRTEWHLLKHAAYYNPKQSLQPHKSTYGSFSHAVLGAEKTRVEKDNNPDHISGEAYEKKYTWVDMCNKFNEGIEFEQNHAKAQQPEIYSRLAVCLRRFMLAISTHPDYSNDDSEFGDLYSSGEEVLQEYATALHCKPNISTAQKPDTGGVVIDNLRILFQQFKKNENKLTHFECFTAGYKNALAWAKSQYGSEPK